MCTVHTYILWDQVKINLSARTKAMWIPPPPIECQELRYGTVQAPSALLISTVHTS